MVRDPLVWRSFIRAKTSSQRFMTLDDVIDRGCQSRGIKRAAQTQRTTYVVEGIARLKLIQKPQSLLRERERQLAVFGDSKNRRHLQSAFTLHHLIELASHLSDGGAFKE